MFKKPTFTQFYAIFSLINVQKYFAWLSFRSFSAGMPIFSQIRVGHVTWGPHFGDSLVHPLLNTENLMGPKVSSSFNNHCREVCNGRRVAHSIGIWRGRPQEVHNSTLQHHGGKRYQYRSGKYRDSLNGALQIL